MADEPSAADVQAATEVYEDRDGDGPYDWSRVAFYQAADGRFIREDESRHIDADRSSLRRAWLTEESARAQIEAAREAARRRPPPYEPTPPPSSLADTLWFLLCSGGALLCIAALIAIVVARVG